jgi:bifunctional DNA-binding transcriptional regulator/antitoxin component of YhaV-PrlF toxin-antitoxin module
VTVATMTGKGQVTVPVEVRRECGLEPGAKMDFIVIEPGLIRVEVRPHLADLYGAVPANRSWAPEQLGEAVGAALAADDARIKGEYGDGGSA